MAIENQTICKPDLSGIQIPVVQWGFEKQACPDFKWCLVFKFSRPFKNCHFVFEDS